MAGTLAPPAQRRRDGQDGTKRAPVVGQLRVLVVVFVGALAMVIVLFAREQSSPRRFASERHPLVVVQEERVVGERAWLAPEGERAGGLAGTRTAAAVDDSIAGVRVPFYMYPGMANISRRILDCLSFGIGLDEADAADMTAWFRETLSSPVAQWLTDVAMFAQMERSSWRTHDPEEAEIFYVPVLYGLLSLYASAYTARQKQTWKCTAFAVGAPAGTPGLGEGSRRRFVFQQAIDEMESMPYAQRRRGFDHAWTMTYWGDKSRFMVKEDRSGSPEGERLLAMIERGTYFSRNYVSHFYPHERRAGACIVVIPYFASSLASTVKLDVWPRGTSRAKAQHVAYFRGSMNVHIRLYTEVRKLMLRISEEYPEYGWSVSTSTRKANCEQKVCNDEEKEESGVLPEQMMREMSRSTFCLIPGGDQIDTQRLSIAFAVNCVPVIVARDYHDRPTRAEYTRRFEAGDGVSTREDFFYYAPFSDIVDYSSFAVLVDPIEFTHQPDSWLPDKLAAIAANATLIDSMLLGLAKAARHLVFTDIGSDAGNAALLSASRHCLTRPTDRLPTAEERSATFAAGASWANDETLNFLYDDFTGS